MCPPLPYPLASTDFSSKSTEGLYVDLLANPERFTGYAGPSSSRVWKAIYEENCFTPIPFIDPSTESSTGFAPLSMGLGVSQNPNAMANLGGGFGKLSGWGAGEKRLMGSLAAPRDGGEEICLEKRVFYRLISGRCLSFLRTHKVNFESSRFFFSFFLRSFLIFQDYTLLFLFIFVMIISTKRQGNGRVYSSIRDFFSQL